MPRSHSRWQSLKKIQPVVGWGAESSGRSQVKLKWKWWLMFQYKHHKPIPISHARTVKCHCFALQWPKLHWMWNLDCDFFSFRPQVFVETTGNTLKSHKKFVKKLKKRGARVVTDKTKSDFTILFCPIVSRFECDITAALAEAEGKRPDCWKTCSLCAHNANGWLSYFPPKAKGLKKIILVAMHHTFDQDYALPQHRNMEGREIQLLVECLFFENQGLLKCPRNKEAQKRVCQEVIQCALNAGTINNWIEDPCI